MLSFISRAARLPLALSVAALAACSDEPVGVTTPPKLTPHATAVAATIVTNKSGGTEVGSLRWAARQGWNIQFDPSLAGDTITLDSTLVVLGSATIEGPASKGITISGGGVRRVIHAPYGATLRNLTIKRGAGPDGSAIYADSGNLYLDHVTVSDNHGSSAAIHGNSISLFNTTVSGNTGDWYASGIAYAQNGFLALFNSTIAHNGPAAGIGWYPAGPYSATPSVYLRAAIISNNGQPQMNCRDSVGFYRDGMNLSSDNSCGTVRTLVADPLLGGLRDNGGPNMTEALNYRSPAVNAGVSCYPREDQRWVMRDAKCDIGAFEFTDFTTVTITIDPTTKVSATTGKALLTGTIRCTRNDTFRLALELHQDQKVSGQVVDVHSASDIPVACTTSAQPWSATMVLSDGEKFQMGAARATAQTFATPEWVTPAGLASAVRITRK